MAESDKALAMASDTTNARKVSFLSENCSAPVTVAINAATLKCDDLLLVSFQ